MSAILQVRLIWAIKKVKKIQKRYSKNMKHKSQSSINNRTALWNTFKNKTAGWYFVTCTSWKMSDTMTPSRMRSLTKMAVKAFERSLGRTAPWAISPHEDSWVILHPSMKCICVSSQLCLRVSARCSSACSITHTHTHTNACREYHIHPHCESQMASGSHALRRRTISEGLTWRSSLGPALP